jgi:hypothetical protein
MGSKQQQAAASSKHQPVAAGSNRLHQATTGISKQQSAVASNLAAASSNRLQQATTGCSKQQQAAASSSLLL